MKFDFNTNDVPVQDDNFEDVPVGKYPCSIEKVELKKTRDEAGEYFSFQFRIIGEKYNNRVLFTNVNVKNNNPVCQNIGLKTLASICQAVGIVKLTDTNELVNKALDVDVRFQQGRNGYSGSNVPKYFKKTNFIPASSPAPKHDPSDDFGDNVPF